MGEIQIIEIPARTFFKCVYQRAEPLLLHVLLLLLLCGRIPLIVVGDWMGGPAMGACLWVCRMGCETVRVGPGTSEIKRVRDAAAMAGGVSDASFFP